MADSSKCVVPCSGNNYINCGGTDHVEVYSSMKSFYICFQHFICWFSVFCERQHVFINVRFITKWTESDNNKNTFIYKGALNHLHSAVLQGRFVAVQAGSQTRHVKNVAFTIVLSTTILWVSLHLLPFW